MSILKGPINQMPTATKSSFLDISKIKNLERITSILSSKISNGDTILLYGDLGVGKTTLSRILINRLQKKNKKKITNVTSPTFSLMNEYLVGDILINHCDLFRIKNNKDLTNLGLFENIEDKILIIEWPKLIKKKPKNRIEIYFYYKKNFFSRQLKIKKYGRCKSYAFLKK